MFKSELPLFRQIHHYSDMTSVFFGFLFNTVLLTVVSKNKEKGLKSFGQVVFMNCVLDIFLTATTLFGEIECTTHKGIFFFFSSSFLAKMIPPFWHYLLIYFFCIGIGFSVFYAPIPFYHRYMLICKGIVLAHKDIFKILLVPMFFSLWITAWQLYAMLQTDTRRDELTPFINNSMWQLPDGTVPMFAAFSLDTLPSIVYLSNCIICFPLSYALPFYLFGKIYHNFLENKGSMSERACQLHKALNRALISQALLPFVLGSMPVSLVMGTLLLRIDIPHLPNIAAATISWIPAVNPIMTMLFVPAYYRAILPKRIMKKLTSTMETSSMQPPISTNRHPSVPGSRVHSSMSMRPDLHNSRQPSAHDIRHPNVPSPRQQSLRQPSAQEVRHPNVPSPRSEISVNIQSDKLHSQQTDLLAP